MQNNGFERSDTAPPECPPDMPLGPSLSQIIRKASNDKARENPIDLTGDDEPVGQTTATVADKPRPDIQSKHICDSGCCLPFDTLHRLVTSHASL